MKITIPYNHYQIALFDDPSFTPDSTDNVFAYNNVHKAEGNQFNIYHAIIITEGEEVTTSAILLSTGGGTTIHENSQVIFSDKLLICSGTYVFCLQLPQLSLVWKKVVDMATAIQIFAMNSDFIVHGELSISRITISGDIIWQKHGSDIFVTKDGIGEFVIKDGSIHAKSWDGRMYIFNYNGDTC